MNHARLASERILPILLVGALDERRHTRELEKFGGLYKIMPRYGAIALLVTLAALGLPGLGGFVGQFAILQGVYARNWAWAAFAAGGLFLSAGLGDEVLVQVLVQEFPHSE